jgi:hypothetical protein
VGSNYTFQKETIEKCWDEVRKLTTSHNKECGIFPDETLEPNREFYELAQRRGANRGFTARISGRLAAYANFWVFESHFHKGQIWATQDVLYVKPEHRGIMAVRFIKWCDDELKKDGIDVVIQHVPKNNGLEKILSHMGYQFLQRSFWRKL